MDTKKEDNTSLSVNAINQLSTNTPERVKRNNLILNHIKENPGITPYRLSKDVQVNYTDVSRIIQDLEYCGLIIVQVVLRDNRANKELYVIEGDKK